MRFDPDMAIEELQQERDEARAELERLRAQWGLLKIEIHHLRAAMEQFADENKWAMVDAGVCDVLTWNGDNDEPWTIAQEALKQ
jgi:DNA repair exonuclease SbcCD ATPase subunit